MADIGLKSAKVRAGFYRCGPYCIHRGLNGWGVYNGPHIVTVFRRLGDAYQWCRRASQ